MPEANKGNLQIHCTGFSRNAGLDREGAKQVRVTDKTPSIADLENSPMVTAITAANGSTQYSYYRLIKKVNGEPQIEATPLTLPAQFNSITRITVARFEEGGTLNKKISAQLKVIAAACRMVADVNANEFKPDIVPIALQEAQLGELFEQTACAALSKTTNETYTIAYQSSMDVSTKIDASSQTRLCLLVKDGVSFTPSKQATVRMANNANKGGLVVTGSVTKDNVESPVAVSSIHLNTDKDVNRLVEANELMLQMLPEEIKSFDELLQLPQTILMLGDANTRAQREVIFDGTQIHIGEIRPQANTEEAELERSPLAAQGLVTDNCTATYRADKYRKPISENDYVCGKRGTALESGTLDFISCTNNFTNASATHVMSSAYGTDDTEAFGSDHLGISRNLEFSPATTEQEKSYFILMHLLNTALNPNTQNEENYIQFKRRITHACEEPDQELIVELYNKLRTLNQMNQFRLQILAKGNDCNQELIKIAANTDTHENLSSKNIVNAQKLVDGKAKYTKDAKIVADTIHNVACAMLQLGNSSLNTTDTKIFETINDVCKRHSDLNSRISVIKGLAILVACVTIIGICAWTLAALTFPKVEPPFNLKRYKPKTAECTQLAVAAFVKKGNSLTLKHKATRGYGQSSPNRIASGLVPRNLM